MREVDVEAAGRAEHDSVARRPAAKRVACGVVAAVGLHLDEAAADSVVQEDAAEKVGRDLQHRAREESGRQRYSVVSVARDAGRRPIAGTARSRAPLGVVASREPRAHSAAEPRAARDRVRERRAPRRAARARGRAPTPPGDRLARQRGLGREQPVVGIVEGGRERRQLFPGDIRRCDTPLEAVAHERAARRRGPRGRRGRDRPGSRRCRWRTARRRTRRRGVRRRRPPPRAARDHRQQLVEAVDGVEEVALVLAQVGGVGERQPVHYAEQALQVGGQARRGGAHELGRVGVHLLRHDARAAAVGLGQAHEAELRRRPQDELGADARQVRTQAAAA